MGERGLQVSSAQTVHIELGVNLVLTPASRTGTFHPMILAFSLLVSCVRQVIGVQKHMFMDFFIHATSISQVPAMGQAERAALGGGVSPSPSWFPLSKVICDGFSLPGPHLPLSVPLGRSLVQP